MLKFATPLAGTLLAAAPAHAHGGHTEVYGPMHGLLHLVGGLDNLLLILAVAGGVVGGYVWRRRRTAAESHRADPSA